MLRALGVLLFFFAAPACAQDEDGTPVGKVAELLEELRRKIEHDGENEQAMFDRFACWCEETTRAKSHMITSAMADIRTHGTMILELKGLVAVRGAEISELNSQIRDNQASQQQATTMRAKANGNFLNQKSEMETTIGSLEKAILVLSGAGTKKLGLLEQKSAMKALGRSVHRAMQSLPLDVALTPRQMKVVEAFLQDPAEYYDQKAAAKESYAPASATIQGILKDMYDSFVKNLEKSTQTESDQVLGYEDLMAVKAKEFATLTAENRIKMNEQADAEASLADAAQEMDDTSHLMDADTKFFEDTKAQCTAKADEWSERVRARTEELAGITKGIEILTSDDAKALFAKAIKPGKETLLQKGGSVSLIQVSDESVLRNKVVETLRRRAKRSKSMRLSALAGEISRWGARQGHFDVVIVQIDKMKGMLHTEEADDIKERDWCKAETFKNEEESSKFEYKVEKADGRINKLEAHLEKLEISLQETISEIESTQQDIKEMEDERKGDHNAFQESKADDEGAVGILNQAIEVLSSFYKTNKKDMGEVQGSTNLLQDDPSFGDENTPPGASFSDSGKSKGESKGIVSILTMLKEDLEDEIANGVKAEEEEQKAFESAKNKAQAAVDRLTQKKTNTKSSIAENGLSTDDTKDVKDQMQEMKDQDETYLEDIKPDCDWMLENFQARKEKRAEEVEGLTEAVSMLNGAGFALVQSSKGFLKK